MPDAPSAPLPTPTNYQRTAGGHLQWQPPTPEHLQEMLPAYEVMSILGQGGMGAVYKGRQKSLDRVVAIKILPPEAAEDDMQFAERFKNEARTMAKMNHPAIVHVYDFGETTEGQLYIVMEFIDGTDVAKMIQSQGKLPEDYALSITAHVCDALGYAHTQGVVHRDIKPANVLINQQGQVKVADFGLAKATDPSQMGLTKTNMAMGTPDFVSPEALMPGVPLDGRADLYAVGVMLYNMLTGTIPRGAFRMPSATLQTDARFDQIIQKAMEMDRERRYQTALDLRRDLDVILTTPAAKSGVQTIPAQAALPQKPMGKSPGAPARNASRSDAGGPQQRSADAPIRKEPAAKPARAPVQAPKKSNAAMIYGIVAAVAVIAGGAFMFSGGGKKPAAAGRAAGPPTAAAAPPQTALAGASALPKPATPPPSKPTPKPAESKPAPAPAVVASGNEKWVDGLAQWFGGTKTNEAFVRENNGGARVELYANLMPIPPSTPTFRDQAVRVRARFPLTREDGDLRLYVRRDTGAGTKKYFLTPYAWDQRVRLACDMPGKTGQALADFPLPAGFDYEAAHTLELRIVDDLLTVSVDGKKLGERRDSRYTDGHPAISAKNITIESFEYANLDPGGAAPAPALAAAKPSPASPVEPAPPVEPVLTNTLGMKFVPVPITGGPTGGQRVLFSVWDTRVQDYAVFATETKRKWTKPEFEQDPTHPVVAVNWEDAQAFCAWLTERERKAGKLGANEHYRLPSDHEWSCAVGIGEREDAAKLPGEKHKKLNDVFPWGTQWPPPKGTGNYPGEESRSALAGGKYANNVLEGYDDGFVHTSPVGSFAANRFGLYDLGGNVLQWCEDWFDASQKDRVMRGAAWMYFSRDGLLSSIRSPVPPGGANRVYGFRCVLAGSVATAAPSPAAAPTPAVASTMPAAAPAPAPAAPVAPADPRLAQLAAGFKARHEADALQPFNTALAALNTSYLANGVARARTAAKAKGSLAEVTALDAEKTAIEQGRGVPDEDDTDTPDSLKTLRATYRTAHAKFATERDAKAAPLYDLYLKALDAYIAELTQADKIDVARKVQVFRDDIAAQKSGAGAAATPPATGASVPASAPPAAEIKGSSWRAAATWCLEAKGTVWGKGFGPTFNVKDLPSGRFEINRLAFGDVPPGTMTDATLAHLNGLRELTRFDAGIIAEVTGPGLEVFRTTPKVTELVLSKATQLKDEHLAPLGALKELKALWIDGGKFTGAVLPHLAACKKLESLDLAGLALSAEQAGKLHTLFPALKSLRLGSLTKETLSVVGKFTWLETLNLVEDNELTDDMLAPLSGLTALRKLQLRGCAKLQGTGLAAFAGSRELRQLNFSSCASATGAALPVIGRLFPKLEKLDVMVKNATDEDFKSLCAHPSLMELTLNETPVTDNWLASIATLPKLQYLAIWGTHTAAGIEHLLQSKSLTVLVLNVKNMDASVVAVLKKFKNLKTLDLKGDAAKATADEIRKALPGCNVIAQ